MKKKKLKEVFDKVIQVPLRFHHQDIHQELEQLRLQMYRLEGMIQVLLKRENGE